MFPFYLRVGRRRRSRAMGEARDASWPLHVDSAIASADHLQQQQQLECFPIFHPARPLRRVCGRLLAEARAQPLRSALARRL